MSSEAIKRMSIAGTALIAMYFTAAPLAAQMCGPSQLPDNARNLGAFLDSTKLVNDLALSGNEASGVAALHFQTNGRLLRAVWLEPPAVEAVANALPTAAAGALKNVPRGKAFGVRVRVTGGASPALSMSPSEYCAPEPMTDNMARPATEPANMTRAERADFQRAGPYRMQIDVDTLGRPGRVNMIQSSGSAPMDRLAADNARIMRFTPAKLDGLLAPGMYEVSVRP